PIAAHGNHEDSTTGRAQRVYREIIVAPSLGAEAKSRFAVAGGGLQNAVLDHPRALRQGFLEAAVPHRLTPNSPVDGLSVDFRIDGMENGARVDCQVDVLCRGEASRKIEEDRN